MALATDVEKLPQGGGVNKPDSGTYGEKADINQLRAQLPASGAPMAPPQPGPPPMPVPAGTVPQPIGRPSGPGGVPSAIMQPSQTATPVNTPLAPSPGGVVTAAGGVQARLNMLQQLSTSPDVSAATREWASMLLEMLAEAT